MSFRDTTSERNQGICAWFTQWHDNICCCFIHCPRFQYLNRSCSTDVSFSSFALPWYFFRSCAQVCYSHLISLFSLHWNFRFKLPSQLTNFDQRLDEYWTLLRGVCQHCCHTNKNHTFSARRRKVQLTWAALFHGYLCNFQAAKLRIWIVI